MKTLTWREVFACRTMWGTNDRIVKAARAAGYPYYEWNGRVYEIEGTYGPGSPHLAPTLADVGLTDGEMGRS